VNVTSTSLADTASTASPAPTRRTVDAPTRAFHWLMALCFAGAYITADGERWRLVHVTLGYTLAGLLAFRVVWGLLGPKPVRWTTWWGKLQALPGVVAQLRRGQWPGTLAQNLGMTLAIVGVLLSVALTTATGWITYEEFTGDWIQDVHEFAGNLLLALVLGHIALVAGLSLLRRRNLARTMLSGRTPGRGPDLVKRNHLWLAAVIWLAALGFWAWQWQGAPDQPTAGSAVAATRHDKHSGREHDD
jgi:cytochrome b